MKSAPRATAKTKPSKRSSHCAIVKTPDGHTVCRVYGADVKVTDVAKLSSVPQYFKVLPPETLASLDEVYDSYVIATNYKKDLFLGYSADRGSLGVVSSAYHTKKSAFTYLILNPFETVNLPFVEDCSFSWEHFRPDFLPALEPLGCQDFCSGDTQFFFKYNPLDYLGFFATC